MASLSKLFVFFSLLFTLALASPTRVQKRSFKVVRVRNEKFTGHNGPRALYKAYTKFRMPLPQGLLDAMAAQQAAAKSDAVTGVTKAGGADGLLGGLLGGAAGGGDGQGGGVDQLLGGLLGGTGGQGGGADQLLSGLLGGLGGDATGSTTDNASPAPAAAADEPATTTAQGSKGSKAGEAGSKGSKTSSAAARSSSSAATGNDGKKGKGGKGGKGAAGAGSKNNGTAIATNSTGNAAGTGKVINTPEPNDVEFLSPVTIGGQTLNMDFDSGSSDLWVFNTQLSSKSTAGHVLFDSSKSKTFQAMKGATFSISYGDGSGAAGNVGTDTVDIGGATVTKQAIELATAVSGSFIQDTANQGLVGLAFSELNTVKPQKQKTFFDNVKSNLAEPVFTADLRKGAEGAYEFGFIDSTKFKGNMAWVPVNTTNGFWQFSSQTFAVDNGSPQLATRGGQAIADTGTTLILASPTTVQAYYSKVQGAVDDATVGGITIPCNATLPDLMLDVGGVYMAKVKGSDINFTKVQGNTCFGGLQATTSDLQIYGDIFFKSQFVAFNGGNNTLGMAEHV